MLCEGTAESKAVGFVVGLDSNLVGCARMNGEKPFAHVVLDLTCSTLRRALALCHGSSIIDPWILSIPCLLSLLSIATEMSRIPVLLWIARMCTGYDTRVYHFEDHNHVLALEIARLHTG